MKRNAFSLVELIFVVVLIGVISGIGFYMSRPDYSRQDAQYALLKLKEARYRALGYDALDNAGCVTLTQVALSSNETPKHEIKSTITLTPNVPTICFDGMGRPHNGNSVTLNTLLPGDLNINFKNSD
ncbi:type II secretion system protein, partial [Sulfuricurvum sp.]|uniref:type II secretion system protein n=1 Tax=Sulfuricurvum sp. TaxID=2025608 RepID=UPI00261C0338